MCCYHPISIVDKHSGKVRSVPCGKCIGCLQDYQNSWKIRLSDELKNAGYQGVFFTLTYDPKCAVDTGNVDEFCKFSPFAVKHDQHRVLTVWKDDVQKWIKRCRRRMEYCLGFSVNFKYFITSEYGPLTLRPHYHGIFIGLSLDYFEKFFLNDWNSEFINKYYKRYAPGRFKIGNKYYKLIKNKFYKGNVVYEQIVFDNNKSPDSCADYVSKYCSKGFFENPRVERGDVAKTFHLVSKRMGLCAISSLKDSILQDYKECSCIVSDKDFSNTKHFTLGKVYSKDYYFGLLTNYNSSIHELEPSYFETGVRHSYDSDGNITKTWYDTVFCLTPRLDFMREVCKRAFIVRYDKKKDKTYKYKLPRYYYEKIFPKDTAIRKAMSDVLQLLSDEDMSRKLGQLSTMWPNETPSQIYHRYLVQNSNELSRRESQAISYARKFYGQSIL